MKLCILMVLPLVLTAACASDPPRINPSPSPETAPTHPSQELCDKVYDNLLTNVVKNSLDDGVVLTPDQSKLARALVDAALVKMGKKEQFYNVCLTKAPMGMASCWLQAPSLEAMNECTILWGGKLD